MNRLVYMASAFEIQMLQVLRYFVAMPNKLPSL